MKDTGHFEFETFPISRLATMDVCAMGLKKHYMHAYIEVDVTEARQKLRARKKEGMRVSFTAWLLSCIAAVCHEYPEIHSMRYGRQKTVRFEDVDISMIVEREVGGKKVPLPCVIRKAESKSAEELCREIESAKSSPISDEGDYVLGDGKSSAARMKLYYALPAFLRRAAFGAMIKNPFRAKREMGTVLVTALGMMGKFKGYFVPIGIHPLEFGVGSVVKKPGVVQDKIEIRDTLYLTVMLDHDTVDGAPAAMALQSLTEKLESGFGL